MKISLFRKAKAGGLAKVPEPPRPTPVLASLQSVLLLPICRLFISSFSASRCILHHLFYLILGLLSSQLLFFTHSSILAVIVFSIYCSHLVFSDFQLQCLPVSWFFQLEFHLAFVCQVFAQSYTISSFAATHHCFDAVPFDSLEVQTMTTVSEPFAHRIVRRTTRSFTFKDGVCTVIDHLGIPPASVCTHRNCRSLHDMARYFLSSRPPRSLTTIARPTSNDVEVARASPVFGIGLAKQPAIPLQ